ncbi:MAG: hypothetical protein JO222_06770 [Frankiales bacterium]|nr:hypothetical protein [Frankiales bacterium]
MTVVAANAFGAGAIGFLVVLALVAGSVFLFRSMAKHLRSVPPQFPPPEAEQNEQPAAPASSPPPDQA